MKLYLNPPSPYARKVVVWAHELGLADRVELYEVDPWIDPPALLDVAPLGRIPALVTADGLTIVESMAICDYLADQAGRAQPTGIARADLLARVGVAQGLIDAAFNVVIEKRRPPEMQWQAWLDRQHHALHRTLPTIAVPARGRFDLGDVTLACALTYLDFRLPDVPWRATCNELAAWLDDVCERAPLLATKR